MSNQVRIPAKSTFKQNEVCQITGVKPYVLKFWEEQFEEINPITSAVGKKLYEHGDIEAIALVKQLLFDYKLSIDDAKKEIKIRLKTNADEKEETDSSENNSTIPVEIAHELKDAKLLNDQAIDSQVQQDLEDFEQTIVHEINKSSEVNKFESKEFDQNHFEHGSILDQVIEKKTAESKQIKIKKSQFTDKDKQNLILAKAKLQNMLMVSNQIKARENIQ